MKKERLSAEDADAALARIAFDVELAGWEDRDLVIEAATENVDLKYRIFTGLDEVARPEAILATNTSSISVTAIAARTSRPDKVIGMHFMNPVPVMKLVEIIRGIQTSDATYAAVNGAAEAMGKLAAPNARSFKNRWRFRGLCSNNDRPT